MRAWPAPVRVAVRSVGFAAAILLALLLSGAVDPVDLLAPSPHGQGADVVVDDFGAAAVGDAEDPFDGQYIYVTARLLPDLDAIADEIHESSYRLPRILHPLLASPVPAGNATVLALQAWNLVGMGLLTWAMADLLARHGFPPTWAFAAPVACGLALLLTTSEPLAVGLGMAGVAAVDRGRLLPAVGLLALAGLTRESALTLAVVAGAVLWFDQRRRGTAVGLVVASAAPFVAWWAYVQTITDDAKVPLEPFGIFRIGGEWWVNLVAAGLALALMVVAAFAWWDVPVLRYIAIAYLAWIPAYEAVAYRIIGLPRLSIPAIALGLAGLVRWRTTPRIAPLR